MSGAKHGLLLINLGTPERPEPEAVGRYLKEFLMDKYVVDIPAAARWALVNLAIVPRRKHASAKAYKEVWTERGSPLLFHLKDLASGVDKSAGGRFETAFAMRYGTPSLESGLRVLLDCSQILAFPLYPQYAESSTRSSVEAVKKAAHKLGYKGKLDFVPAFYDEAGFIDAFAEQARATLDLAKPNHVLFSFHGLPEAHVRATDRSPLKNHCLASPNCCEKIVDANRDCYRAQSYATARNLAAKLKLADGSWSVAFQSRLGRRPWIKPYTDIVYKELAQKGVKTLAVVCPSFVADCLETLEEIRIRGEADFLAAGGEKLVATACLNSSASWASAVASIAARRFGLEPRP